jgi:vancomycin resistance protein VanJ
VARVTDFQETKAPPRKGWVLRLLYALSMIYPAFLLFLAFVINPFVGERNATFAFLLYLPQLIWLVPLLPLAAVSWRVGGRAFWVHPVALFLFVIWGMGWQLGGLNTVRPPVHGLTIKVMTFNRGQNSSYSLQPFKNKEQPDVILLQEAPRRTENYRRADGYKEYPYIEGTGEFIAISKWPILEYSEIRSSERVNFEKHIQGKPSSGHPEAGDLLAVRLVLELPDGIKFALYNVHFPTPRDMLTASKRGGFLWGILGIPGTFLAKRRVVYESYWRQRIKQASHFINEVNGDPLPTIVAGDFNMPANGYIYRLFAANWEDSHCEAGRGLGYTFPGKTRNPLSLGGAWLRLDYVFSKGGWKAVSSTVESSGQSQHRPICSTLMYQAGSQ